jgi:hypothetical protein
MIEAVGATLAPFTKQEKPKVSTWLAVSLIKKGPASAGYGPSASITEQHEATIRGRFGITIGPFLLGFRGNLTQRKQIGLQRQIGCPPRLHTTVGSCPS